MQEHAKLESGSQSLQRRIASSEKIIADFTDDKKELEEKLANATGENNRLQTRLEAMNQAYEKEINKVRNDLALSISESTEKLATLRRVLTDEQEKTKKIGQRCAEVQEHAKNRIKELAEEAEKQDNKTEELIVAKDEVLGLKNALNSLQEEKLRSARNHDAECHRLQHAIESLHHEIRLKAIEANEISKTVDGETKKAAELSKTLMSSSASLKRSEQNCKLLEGENQKLSSMIEDMKHENESLKRELEALANGTNDMKQAASQARKEVNEVSRRYNSANYFPCEFKVCTLTTFVWLFLMNIETCSVERAVCQRKKTFIGLQRESSGSTSSQC